MPTPAVFELDYVCKGRVRQGYTSTEPFDEKDLPDGCSFRCRDNMTTVCRKEADAGACTDPKLAGVMRSQCAGSCGVCTGLGLVAEAESAYKRRRCADTNEMCEGWAETGECVRNWAYMSRSCASSCGACRPKTSKEPMTDPAESMEEQVRQEQPAEAEAPADDGARGAAEAAKAGSTPEKPTPRAEGRPKAPPKPAKGATPQAKPAHAEAREGQPERRRRGANIFARVWRTIRRVMCRLTKRCGAASERDEL